MKYKSVCNTEYEILGWEGDCLRVKHPGGRIFILTPENTAILLSKHPFPGRPMIEYGPAPWAENDPSTSRKVAERFRDQLLRSYPQATLVIVNYPMPVGICYEVAFDYDNLDELELALEIDRDLPEFWS